MLKLELLLGELSKEEQHSIEVISENNFAPRLCTEAVSFISHCIGRNNCFSRLSLSGEEVEDGEDGEIGGKDLNDSCSGCTKSSFLLVDAVLGGLPTGVP